MNLTPRQAEILLWVQRGLSNKQIAKRLNLVESTVKLHMTGILKKYGVKNRTQLAVFSTQNQTTPVEVEGLEDQPIGWIKRSGKRIVGIVFTPTSPASGWIAIYQKEKT